MSMTSKREGEAPAEPPQDGRLDPVRKRPDHGVLAGPNQPTIVLITVCTRHRQKWLVGDEIHALLQDVWRAAAAWMVGKYVIMPDHLHLFAGAADPVIRLERWMQYWKSQFSKKHGDPDHGWQPGHWDRRVRSSEQYARKWEYVRGNPVRHNLVESACDWPYQGQIYQLSWDT